MLFEIFTVLLLFVIHSFLWRIFAHTLTGGLQEVSERKEDRRSREACQRLRGPMPTIGSFPSRERVAAFIGDVSLVEVRR